MAFRISKGGVLMVYARGDDEGGTEELVTSYHDPDAFDDLDNIRLSDLPENYFDDLLNLDFNSASSSPREPIFLKPIKTEIVDDEDPISSDFCFKTHGPKRKLIRISVSTHHTQYSAKRFRTASSQVSESEPSDPRESLLERPPLLDKPINHDFGDDVKFSRMMRPLEKLLQPSSDVEECLTQPALKPVVESPPPAPPLEENPCKGSSLLFPVHLTTHPPVASSVIWDSPEHVPAPEPQQTHPPESLPIFYPAAPLQPTQNLCQGATGTFRMEWIPRAGQRPEHEVPPKKSPETATQSSVETEKFKPQENQSLFTSTGWRIRKRASFFKKVKTPNAISSQVTDAAPGPQKASKVELIVPTSVEEVTQSVPEADAIPSALLQPPPADIIEEQTNLFSSEKQSPSGEETKKTDLQEPARECNACEDHFQVLERAWEFVRREESEIAKYHMLRLLGFIKDGGCKGSTFKKYSVPETETHISKETPTSKWKAVPVCSETQGQEKFPSKLAECKLKIVLASKEKPNLSITPNINFEEDSDTEESEPGPKEQENSKIKESKINEKIPETNAQIAKLLSRRRAKGKQAPAAEGNEERMARVDQYQWANYSYADMNLSTEIADTAELNSYSTWHNYYKRALYQHYRSRVGKSRDSQPRLEIYVPPPTAKTS